MVVADVLRADGEALVAELPPARFVELDVSSEASWIGVIEEIRRREGRLDGLVNNAGIARPGLVSTTSYETWREVMAVNLDGTFLGLKYGCPAIAASGGSAACRGCGNLAQKGRTTTCTKSRSRSSGISFTARMLAALWSLASTVFGSTMTFASARLMFPSSSCGK